MAKAVETVNEMSGDKLSNQPKPPMDSKYRMIIVAAQRSKELARGARPRVEIDAQRHKTTRIAVEEVQRGKVSFSIKAKD